ncbi:anti-sigma factor [Paenibacillus piri]|uniref:Anti-sigma-W factor RsiW n=1 Tax=Paenibacillus piri TaxID=2547395 RepID=A0A4R5KNU0_9BACL|nr:anti-sigma factor [Paenibacillus piri]TDF96615.1 hypothetical protein E1757_16090 [Paenibacillus piri]
MTQSNNTCERMFAFFLNELPEQETEAFKLHLAACPSCRDEWNNLQRVWQTLPFEMDETDIPDSLKERMFEQISRNIQQPLHAEEQEIADEPFESESPPLQKAKPAAPISKRWTYAAAAVVFAMIGAAAGWGINEYGRSHLAASDRLAAPAKVVDQYALKAFDPDMPAASGHCWIKEQGKSKQLVVQVNGLGRNAGDEAYQVWIVKEGTRFNGGTFQVDDKGSGVLTYDLNSQESGFDRIGITLEPDAKGTKPRGKKVLGTS